MKLITQVFHFCKIIIVVALIKYIIKKIIEIKEIIHLSLLSHTPNNWATWQ